MKEGAMTMWEKASEKEITSESNEEILPSA